MRHVQEGSISTFLVSLATAGIVFSDTLRYPDVQGQGFGRGPAFYPDVLAVTLIAMGIIVLVHGIKVGPLEEKYEAAARRERPRLDYRRVSVIFILSVLSILAMNYLGFFISGFLLILLSIFFIRKPGSMKTAALDVAFSGGMILLVYLVFEVFVKIQLPRSILIG